MQACGVAVPRAGLVELHTSGAGRLLESALLLRFATVLAARRWLAAVDHFASMWGRYRVDRRSRLASDWDRFGGDRVVLGIKNN